MNRSIASLTHDQLCREIGAALTPDLLNKQWREIAAREKNPFTGHCYVGAEAAYHLLGGKEAGWVSRVINLGKNQSGQTETHWYVQHRETGEIVDPTAPQFEDDPIPYEKSHGCGFLTTHPSRRAAIVMARVIEKVERREAMATMARSSTLSPKATDTLLWTLSR